jgi:hypothetical protein
MPCSSRVPVMRQWTLLPLDPTDTPACWTCAERSGNRSSRPSRGTTTPRRDRLHRSAEERRRPRSTAFGLPPPSPVGPPEAACRQGECCSASATARRPTPASNPVIRRAAVRDSSATLLRSSRSFAPNLGTSRGQYVLLEELDCELGDGVSSRTPGRPLIGADRAWRPFGSRDGAAVCGRRIRDRRRDR